MKYYVYFLKCNNTVFYVGKGAGSRMYRHLYIAKNTKKTWPVLNKIRNMLKNNIDIQYEKVFETNDSQEAYEKEIEYIKLIGRKDLNTGTLLNLTDGGEGPLNHTFTKEHRKNISIGVKKAIKEGRFAPPFKDKHLPAELIKKLSDANKEFFATEEGLKMKEHLRNIQKNLLVDGKRILSDDAVKKMSEARKGKEPWNKGKKNNKENLSH